MKACNCSFFHLFLCIVLFVHMFCFTSAAFSTQQVSKTDEEIVFLTWSDYMDPQLVEEFEKRYGVSVKFIYYGTDDLRDDKLLATNAVGYDLMVCNGASLFVYNKKGWLAPLTKKEVPNLNHIATNWTTAFKGAEGKAMPFFWGTVGIAYRKDKVVGKVTSWGDIYSPADKLHGRIMMIKTARDAIGMALKYLGYSVNTTDKQHLAEAGKLLMAQKPMVHSYSYPSLEKDSKLITGEVWMAMIYNGDAVVLQELDQKIDFIVPKEGTNLWVDYLTVLQSSPKKELAYKFINFLNEPQNAARLAEFLYYATPNKAAEKLLPADFIKDTIIYPPKEILDKSEAYQVLTPRALKKINTIFSRVTR